MKHENFVGFTSQVAEAQIPENAPAASTARAIYTTGRLVIPYDRRSFYAGADELDKRLRRWMDSHETRINAVVKAARLPTDSSQFLSYSADGGNFRCTPNGSCGYMYCAYWLDPVAEIETTKEVFHAC